MLEIGAGSGYQAAILSRLVKEAVSIERIPKVAEQERSNLTRLNITNVMVVVADGTRGWQENSPYDGILVTAATPEVPPPLIDQLADGGRLVAPVGGRGIQELIKLVKRGERVERTYHGGVAFVPLIGRYGWQESDEGY